MLRTQAIVLSTRPYKERDELCSFFTRDFGKRTVVARGTKKPLSKLGPFLHALTIVDCGFVEGKNYPILTNIDTLYDWGGKGKYISLLPFMYAFFDLCDCLLYDEQQDYQLWDFFLHIIVQAEEYDGQNAETIYERWLWRLLAHLGISSYKEYVGQNRESLSRIFFEQWGRQPFLGV